MGKLLLSFFGVGFILAASMPAVANSTMPLNKTNIKAAAYVKTAVDILSYPIAMLSVAGVVGGGLRNVFKSEFIDDKLSSMVGFGTGLGIGALAGMVFRACYVKAHKLLGFTDQEIEEICAESYAQQLWILAQAGSVALVLCEYNNAQKGRNQKEKKSSSILIINV